MINSNATKDVNGYDFLNTAKSTKKADSIDAAQDRFMKLLVTQLQTQDPMNPMDNAAMTSQMAQISTVQGIEKLNQSMTSLSEMRDHHRTILEYWVVQEPRFSISLLMFEALFFL